MAVGFRLLCTLILLQSFFCLPVSLKADAISDNPIVFVTMVPNPNDFGTLAATFGNHIPTPQAAFRGGDLYIRYANGTLKNLTAAAGFGTTGFQGANAIAVRDPSVYWNGAKVIFSMVVGAPTQRYQVIDKKWQLYEITGLGPSDTPVITKVPNQPTAYNNHSPIYASDDTILFVSDRPRDDGVLHTYPQLDEYESSPINTGIWNLHPGTGALRLLDHAPSGDFNPIIDSFGRVIFTRWDHLQRDQQNAGANYGAFNFQSEGSTVATASKAEVFPEPRSEDDPDRKSNVNLFTINQFFPWMMNQDGTDLETLNHIGRQEVGIYTERNFNDDPNVQEFYGQYTTGQNQNEFSIFLHIKEDPAAAGVFLGTNCQEFGTHSSGQLISINGAPGINPDNMVVTYLTHPDTAAASNSPSVNHSGLYRDPLPLSNGVLIASHTSNTREDANIGTGANPLSRFSLRLKQLAKSGAYYSPSVSVTSGITKTISFWNPDNLVSYSGELWEVMPVELKSRPRPTAPRQHLPNIEAGILNSLNISLEELQTYLRQQNLALVVSRNITMRDRNDRQQPTNLRVAGTQTQSIPRSGKVYDVALMQFMQGDLIRGYTNAFTRGRRVIAQPMHSVETRLNLTANMPGAVRIAEDGSMAAFVPAQRALSWQLTASDGTPFVRERYWLTFQPGEVRVCSSCHGINTADHLGKTEPINPPLALAQLLSHWKNLPPPVPTATPTRTPQTYKISVKGTAKAGKSFTVTGTAPNAQQKLALRMAVNGAMCAQTKNFPSKRVLRGKYPLSLATKISFMLTLKGKKTVLARQNIKVAKVRKSKKLASKVACRRLVDSLR